MACIPLPQEKPEPNSANIYRINGKRGFTLVELLISIAVIGVLSAIAVPAYTGYIEKMNNDKAKTDIYQIQNCIERYHTETFQYPPTIATIADCLPNNGLDPWGNAYVYLNIINGGHGIHGQVRKDHATNPINTLYDLYSMGKDGDTHVQVNNAAGNGHGSAGRDDIVLGRDGAFVGLGADF